MPPPREWLTQTAEDKAIWQQLQSKQQAYERAKHHANEICYDHRFISVKTGDLYQPIFGREFRFVVKDQAGKITPIDRWLMGLVEEFLLASSEELFEVPPDPARLEKYLDRMTIQQWQTSGDTPELIAQRVSEYHRTVRPVWHSNPLQPFIYDNELTDGTLSVARWFLDDQHVTFGIKGGLRHPFFHPIRGNEDFIYS